jgi:hypothetical protein
LNNEESHHLQKLSPNQQKPSPNENNKSHAQIPSSNETEALYSNSGASLIDKLEIQKEKTNQLLLKSKAKHNELISSMSTMQYH